MADYGLLGGLAEGLNKGFESFKDESRYQEELAKKRREEAQAKKMFQLGLVKEGLVESPTGEFSKTPEAIEKEQYEATLKKGGLLGHGITTTRGEKFDPVTGNFEVGFDPEYLAWKERMARAAAQARADQPKVLPASVVESLASAKNIGQSIQDAAKKLEELDQQGITTGKPLGLIRGIQKSYEIGDTGKKLAEADASVKLVAQRVGTILEGGKLAEGDIARYTKMLPSTDDSLQVRLDKLQRVYNLMQVEQRDKLKAFEAQGYKVGGLEQLPDVNFSKQSQSSGLTEVQRKRRDELRAKYGRQ